MTERTPLVCSICGGDRFFALHGEQNDACLVCAGCGVKTPISLRTGEMDNLVEAPE
jgi:hypothetical protein